MTVNILSYLNPCSALKQDLPFFLLLSIRQIPGRNHNLCYLKCSPSTVFHYAIHLALMEAAEIFHYYSVFCHYSPVTLFRSECHHSVKRLFVYLNPLLFSLEQGMSGHWVSVALNETVQIQCNIFFCIRSWQSIDYTIIKDHSAAKFFLIAVNI